MKFELGDTLTPIDGGGMIWIVTGRGRISSGQLEWDAYDLKSSRDGDIITIDAPLVESELRKIQLSKLYKLVLGVPE